MIESEQYPLGSGGKSNPSLSKGLLFALALCAGAAVANLYYAQPLLALIGESFDAPTRVGLIAMSTQIGYTLGILFILPLGDLVERKRLTLSLVAVLALSTLACAFAPSVSMLALASVCVGIGATITQIMVPLAADLANEEQRGRAVGVVFSGILAGILLARTVSGAIGQVLGWRLMFVIASIAALALGVMPYTSLPRIEPKTSQRYTVLLGSLFRLLAQHPSLRTACMIQACLFAIFSAFWSILALLLSKAPFSLGPAVAGGFGIVGLVGVGAANVSGRLLTRLGRNVVLRLGLACCVMAWGVFAMDVSLRGLIVGVLLLDFGLSIANVSNQTMILGLDEQARSRINTIYVTAIFLGGSVGSGAASMAWAYGGWPMVCAFGLGVAVLALGVHAYELIFAHRKPMNTLFD